MNRIRFRKYDLSDFCKILFILSSLPVWILKWRGFSLFRFRSPLLTESLSLSFPPVTEMFHFTGYRDACAMNSHKLEQVLPRSGYPIRKSTGQSVFAALRSLTQLTTSFIAYWHQGIHDALFVA